MTVKVTAEYGHLAHEYTPVWVFGAAGKREHGKWSTEYTVDLPEDLIAGYYGYGEFKEPCINHRGQMWTLTEALSEKYDNPRIIGVPYDLPVISRRELQF